MFLSGWPENTPYAKKTSPIVVATSERMRAIRATSRSSGDGGRFSWCDSMAILPNSVRIPTALRPYLGGAETFQPVR